MTVEQRHQAEGFHADLAAALSPGGQAGAAGRHALVSAMLMTYPLAGASQQAGIARGEAYAYALEDLPAWAVDSAIKGWHRGAWGVEHDYRWAPAPATLRTLAQAELVPIERIMAHIDGLINALPLERALDSRPLGSTLRAVG